jgi:hypothetical protein
MGEWRYSSTILDHGTRWRWVISFTPRLLYPWGKRPRYPLDRRLGGPQSLSVRCGEEQNLAPAGTRARAVHPVAIPTPVKHRYWASPAANSATCGPRPCRLLRSADRIGKWWPSPYDRNSTVRHLGCNSTFRFRRLNCAFNLSHQRPVWQVRSCTHVWNKCVKCVGYFQPILLIQKKK